MALAMSAGSIFLLAAEAGANVAGFSGWPVLAVVAGVAAGALAAAGGATGELAVGARTSAAVRGGTFAASGTGIAASMAFSSMANAGNPEAMARTKANVPIATPSRQEPVSREPRINAPPSRRLHREGAMTIVASTLCQNTD
jgi:hypothetical protein